MRLPQQHHKREESAETNGDGQADKDQRIRFVVPASAQSARDRRGHAAANSSSRHRLHHHQNREHQAHRGKGLGAEPADEICLANADDRLRYDKEEVGRRKPQQCAEDRRLEHRSRADR